MEKFIRHNGNRPDCRRDDRPTILYGALTERKLGSNICHVLRLGKADLRIRKPLQKPFRLPPEALTACPKP